MNAKIQGMFEEVQALVDRAYDEEITMQEAEKLATRLLSVQMTIAKELATVKLDARMRKSGVKAVKAVAYLDEVKKHDKKPSDSYLEHVVNTNENVNKEQDAFDAADVNAETLETLLSVFKEAHIHFRSISRGAYNG